MPCSEEEYISLMTLVGQRNGQFSSRYRNGEEIFNLITSANHASCAAWWNNLRAAAGVNDTPMT